MNDRELLEAAAKAAGMVLTWEGPDRDQSQTLCKGAWNPLAYDGDALRLAVKLRLSIDHNHPADNDAWVMASHCDGMGVGPTEEVNGEASRPAATRRAIVRAAAALAREVTP
jgi:hypothetical protein